MPSSRKRKNTFPSKLKTASTFYPKGTMSKSADRIYKVSMNPNYAPGGPGSAIKWLTYYMNRAGKDLKNRKEIMKARRMLQKVNKSGPFRPRPLPLPRKRKKSRKPKKSSHKSHTTSFKMRHVVLPPAKTRGSRKPTKKKSRKTRNFLTPGDCPTYKELIHNEKIMKDWYFLYTPKAGITRRSTRKELRDFYNSLTKQTVYDVTAFTPGYNSLGPQFPYFQCLYPNYNKNWAYGLNKKKQITKNHVCPSPRAVRRMCANKNRKLKHIKNTFRTVRGGSKFTRMSNKDYKKFCELVQNSDDASISVNRNGKSKNVIFCTYDWGKFAWEHGLASTINI